MMTSSSPPLSDAAASELRHSCPEAGQAITKLRRRNVVQLGKHFPPQYFGGIEVMTELSARALADEYNVTVICHNMGIHRIEETCDGYRVIRCGTQLKCFSQPISLLMGLELRKARPDLIHYHAPNLWGALMIVLFAWRVPLIVTHHADIERRGLLKKLTLPLYHLLLGRTSCVLVNSFKNAETSSDLRGNLSRVAAVPHGIDDRRFILDRQDLSEAARQKQGQFGGRIVIGFIGRLVWYKGLSELLRAVSRLPGSSLLLIGDGPLRGPLEEEVRQLEMSDRVHFVGTVSHAEKVRYLHLMDIFVLPSTHVTEAFGISQIEAQICSLPLVSTSLPTGVSDVNVDGVTGLVVPPGDVEALAAALETLGDNKALRESYGARGRARALEFFSERNYISKLKAEVAQVLLAPS
jgi:glycosyltransferase involved in cell wall biosynthesis